MGDSSWSHLLQLTEGQLVAHLGFQFDPVAEPPRTWSGELRLRGEGMRSRSCGYYDFAITTLGQLTVAPRAQR